MRISYIKGELQGDWAVFAKIANSFVSKVPAEDREDFFQDLLVEMAKVKEKYDAKGKILTEAGLMRVAKYEVLHYWAKRRYRLFGLNCSHCTIEQRRECHTMRLPSECPKGKAHSLLSLDKPVKNDDGDKLTELWELIPDDKSIDLDARLDAIRLLKSLPKGLTKVAYKIYAGYPLNKSERDCLKPNNLDRRRGLLRTLGLPTHCKRGHPFNKANTRVDANGHRTCRICHNESTRKYIDKHKEYYADKRREYYWADIDTNRELARQYQKKQYQKKRRQQAP